MFATVACALPVPQRRRNVCSRLASVVVRAARQGRGGRYPESPHVAGHPLPLADVCSAWRSGRSGAEVLSCWTALPLARARSLYPLEAQFNADGAASDWRRALLAVPPPETICAAAFPQARVLLTTVQPELEAAIALEASLASPGALPLGDGVFAGPVPAPPSRLCRMLSLRAEFDPLAAAASSAGIVAAVAQLDWSALDAFCEAVTRGVRPEWRLHHERVRAALACKRSRELTHAQRGAASDRLPSPELLVAVRNSMRIDASIGDSSFPSVPPLAFVILETERGFLFGLVTCAPAASPALPSVWAGKPHNYCAGLPLPLATLAVNLATALEPSSKTVVDPCCGSGTLLFAAMCLGAGAVAGVERHSLLLRQAAENLAFTAAVAAASNAQLARAALLENSVADVSQVSTATPQLLCADSSQVVFEACGDDYHASVCMRMRAETPASYVPRRKIDALVSNLPYGRMVGVAAADVPTDDHGLEALAPLLSWLRSQATRHAFFSGTRLAPLLRSLGFTDVDEVCVDARGRRFLVLASGGDD